MKNDRNDDLLPINDNKRLKQKKKNKKKLAINQNTYHTDSVLEIVILLAV